MKAVGYLLLLLLLQGCFATEKKDILSTTLSKKESQEDIALLKGIITRVHAGAYAYNSPEQLDHLFDSISQSIDGPLSLESFYNKTDYIIDRLKCVHSLTTLPSEYRDTMNNRAMFFPLPVIVIDNRLFVNSYNFTIPLGAEIIAINYKGAKRIIEALRFYSHTDGNSNVARNSAIDDEFAKNFYMAYGPSSEFVIQYRDTSNGESVIKTMAAEKLRVINEKNYDDTYYFFPTDASYDFEIIDSIKTGILTICTFHYPTYASNKAYDHFIENSFRMIKQNGIKNLIIDCRNNSGGFYSACCSLLSYLVNQPLKEYDSAIKRFDKLPYSSYVTEKDTSMVTDADTSGYLYKEIRKGVYLENTNDIKEWQPDANLFKGKLFVITNSQVMSAASNFVAILKERTKAFIVGEETGGSSTAHNSQVITYELPNSHLKIDVPTLRFYQPVRKEPGGRGVMPHKNMPLTVDDLIDGYDRPMNYILDSLIIK